MHAKRQTEWAALSERVGSLITHPHRAMELVRYGSVGLVNAGLYFGLYSAIIAAGGPYWTAAVSAFLVASSIGYWLHEHFSFRGRNPTLRGLSKWLCAQSGATLLNLALLTVAIHVLHAEEILAQLVLLPILPVATYLLGRRWIFLRNDPELTAVALPAIDR
jgi:putative flippase GtrA